MGEEEEEDRSPLLLAARGHAPRRPTRGCTTFSTRAGVCEEEFSAEMDPTAPEVRAARPGSRVLTGRRGLEEPVLILIFNFPQAASMEDEDLNAWN